MKQFFYKLIPLVIVLLFGAVLWQRIVEKGLKVSAQYGYSCQEWEDIYKGGIDAEVLIMGSSRAKIIINPQTISSSFGKSCYNLGIDGHKFLTQYYRFLLYLQHNKPPKTLLLTLDLLTLIHTKDFYAYEQFIPYLNDTMVQNMVNPSGVLGWKDIHIPMVKFMHRKDMILDGTLAYFRPSNISGNTQNGFLTIDKTWDTAFVRNALALMYADGYTVKIDPETNRLFLKLIDYCKTNNIQMIFVYPPEYRDNLNLCTNRKYVLDYYDSISTIKNILYYNYMDVPDISSDTALFFDSQHLNAKGVDIFNKRLVKDLNGKL